MRGGRQEGPGPTITSRGLPAAHVPTGPSTGTSLGLESQELQSDLPSVRPAAGDKVREVRPVGVERPLLKGLRHEHRLPCVETVHGTAARTANSWPESAAATRPHQARHQMLPSTCQQPA